jgi:FemAB-related protein (PEP-CTERM system-associated)
MTLTVKRLDESQRPAWDRFVRETCPSATFFHLSGWQAVISRVYRQSCPYLYAERAGRIVGLLPLVHLRSRVFGDRLISTGFTVGGGAVAVEDEAYAALDRAMLDLARSARVDSIEIRRPARRHEAGDWTVRAGLYANFCRPIAADAAECLSQIPRKQRAVVRKAQEAGQLTETLETGPEAFFPLYALSMRNMGTPVFGRRFFAALMAEFAGECDCLTIRHQGIPLASVLNFYFRDRVMPYYTGSLPAARPLGANDHMYWRLMRRSVERGCTVFDFGRSKVGTGPFSFKKNWGFEPEPSVSEFWLRGGGAVPDLNPLNPTYARLIALWKRLPLGLANRLGPWVAREIG